MRPSSSARSVIVPSTHVVTIASNIWFALTAVETGQSSVSVHPHVGLIRHLSYIVGPSTARTFFNLGSGRFFRPFLRPSTKNVDRKLLKNLWKTSWNLEPFKNLLEVFEMIWPLRIFKMWKKQKPRRFWGRFLKSSRFPEEVLERLQVPRGFSEVSFFCLVLSLEKERFWVLALGREL